MKSLLYPLLWLNLHSRTLALLLISLAFLGSLLILYFTRRKHKAASKKPYGSAQGPVRRFFQVGFSLLFSSIAFAMAVFMFDIPLEELGPEKEKAFNKQVSTLKCVLSQLESYQDQTDLLDNLDSDEKRKLVKTGIEKSISYAKDLIREYDNIWGPDSLIQKENLREWRNAYKRDSAFIKTTIVNLEENHGADINKISNCLK